MGQKTTLLKKVVAAIKENQSEVSAHDNEPDRFGESAFVVEESLEEDSPKTWDSFLNYLREISLLLHPILSREIF